MDIIWCKDLQDDQKDIVQVDGTEMEAWMVDVCSGDDAQQDELELDR